MSKCFFIAGTDTGVGKTIFSCILLQIFRKIGYCSIGFKPIATGCKDTIHGMRSQDVLRLISSSSVKLDYKKVNPLSFKDPTSPNIASLNEKFLINSEYLSKKLHDFDGMYDVLVIEGTGGWLTPLNDELTYGDWVSIEKIPVILVVGLKLGCINHALLTEFSIRKLGVPLIGWIANQNNEDFHTISDYIRSLKSLLSSPMIGKISWIEDLKIEKLETYLHNDFKSNLLSKIKESLLL